MKQVYPENSNRQRDLIQSCHYHLMLLLLAIPNKLLLFVFKLGLTGGGALITFRMIS